MKRVPAATVLAIAALAPVLPPACASSCDDYAILSEVFVELPPDWTVAQLCVDSVCTSTRTLEIDGERGPRPYRLDVVAPDGAPETFAGELVTYVVPAGRSCDGPALQGRISVRDDGSVTTS